MRLAVLSTLAGLAVMVAVPLARACPQQVIQRVGCGCGGYAQPLIQQQVECVQQVYAQPVVAAAVVAAPVQTYAYSQPVVGCVSGCGSPALGVGLRPGQVRRLTRQAIRQSGRTFVPIATPY